MLTEWGTSRFSTRMTATSCSFGISWIPHLVNSELLHSTCAKATFAKAVAKFSVRRRALFLGMAKSIPIPSKNRFLGVDSLESILDSKNRCFDRIDIDSDHRAKRKWIFANLKVICDWSLANWRVSVISLEVFSVGWIFWRLRVDFLLFNFQYVVEARFYRVFMLFLSSIDLKTWKGK